MKWLHCFMPVFLFITVSSEKGPPPRIDVKSNQLFISHFENVLGTSLELKIRASSEKDAEQAEAAAIKEIGRLQKILSAYDAGSEFSLWLKTSERPVHVSPELFEVLTLFDQWRLRSGGALDASAEIVTKLWKQAAAEQRRPTRKELTDAVAEVKQLHWKLNTTEQTAAHLSHSPLMLNSFAKSYIIRHAADAAMAVSNVQAIVVNIGGDLVVSGDLRETVQISNPKADAENEAPIDELLVSNRAVATSGNYRRGELIDGHWYSHIVDPRTGQPADKVISATVVAPHATDAGALATAFNVLSPSESVRLAAGLPDVEYLIITRSGEHIASKGWNSLEVPTTKQLAPVPGGKHGWANDFEWVIDLQIALQQGFAKRPYVAVWVEDENHAAVRTISVWRGPDRYLQELKSWYLKYRGVYDADKNALSSVSSATRSAGKYTVIWDGKDDKGNVLKPGKYFIKIEASREHGTYQLMRQEIECDETPKVINIPGNAEIASATLNYRKKASGN